jgi:uncharacterized membrane protein
MAYFPTYVGHNTAAVVPIIRGIEVGAIREALEKGVSDFCAMPSHAAFLALVYPLCGMVLAYRLHIRTLRSCSFHWPPVLR